MNSKHRRFSQYLPNFLSLGHICSLVSVLAMRRLVERAPAGSCENGKQAFWCPCFSGFSQFFRRPDSEDLRDRSRCPCSSPDQACATAEQRTLNLHVEER